MVNWNVKRRWRHDGLPMPQRRRRKRLASNTDPEADRVSVGPDEGLGNLVTGDGLLTYGDEFVISGGCALLQLDDRRQSPPVPLPATPWRFHSSSAINPTRYRPCTQSLTYSSLAWTRLVDEPYLRSAWGGQRPIARHRPSARDRPVQPSPIRARATCGAIKHRSRHRHSVHYVTKSILNRRGLVHMWPPQSLTPSVATANTRIVGYALPRVT
jgi:hypothetical protein